MNFLVKRVIKHRHGLQTKNQSDTLIVMLEEYSKDCNCTTAGRKGEGKSC